MIVKSFQNFLNEKKNNFELVQKDGEWAISDTSNGSVMLYGQKAELEKLLKNLNEGVLNEEFKIAPVGLKGAEYHITINGHDYGYVAKAEGDLTIQEIGEKFVKIMKYSAGKALSWLKKNTELASGSKKNESEDIAIFNFVLEHFKPANGKIKLFESFVFEAQESEPDIENLAVDMIDFYGGALPNSPDEYAKVRDIHDKELLMSIFNKALEFDEESTMEAIDWSAIMKKPSDQIYADLKGSKYDPKSLEDYKSTKMDAKQKTELDKAMKMLQADKEKAAAASKEEAKKSGEIAKFTDKIEKLEKEKVKAETGEERKMKIAAEIEKLQKRVKNFK